MYEVFPVDGGWKIKWVEEEGGKKRDPIDRVFEEQSEALQGAENLNNAVRRFQQHAREYYEQP